MTDYQKVCAIYFVVFLPFLAFAVWLFASSFSITMTRLLSMFEIVAMILFFAITMIVWYLYPRCKHYRKALSEFEDNYVYEEAE